MIREETGAIVVGAGVVGLTCARDLSRNGIDVVILEQHEAIGQETSSRSSEVIHSGLYYPSGSLKARLCVEGQQLLYDYCETHGISHRRCGKLVVATHGGQEEKLQQIYEQAHKNGVDDVALITGHQARTIEPELNCTAALESPSTGIIDSHSLMVSLLGEAENRGASLALRARVLSGTVKNGLHEVRVHTDDGEMLLSAGILINAAGLHAPGLALKLSGMPTQLVPGSWFAKGNYFALSGRAPFSHLIYPVPEPGGLGVHLTLDLGQQARFGPDVEWVGIPEYSVSSQRSAGFYAEIRRYWPALPDDALVPAYSGIRPKISAPGAPAADFMIQGPADHGMQGLVNLYGIESPGLTACLAIGQYVCGLLT